MNAGSLSTAEQAHETSPTSDRRSMFVYSSACRGKILCLRHALGYFSSDITSHALHPSIRFRYRQKTPPNAIVNVSDKNKPAAKPVFNVPRPCPAKQRNGNSPATAVKSRSLRVAKHVHSRPHRSGKQKCKEKCCSTVMKDHHIRCDQEALFGLGKSSSRLLVRWRRRRFS
jgi:hypothetical protein